MKKFVIVVAAVFAIMALGGTRATYAQPETVTVNMMEENGSGQNGTATLTMQGDMLMVMVNISGGSSSPQPAHIHRGTCANLDPKPAYPLTSVVNGMSETSVAVSLTELVNGEYAINVHKSGPEAAVYVSCGDIPNMFTQGGTAGGGTTVGMPATGSSDLTFVALLAILGASLMGVGLKLARRKA
ncbi:MAG TPA: hypothetical protein VF952_09980 [Chloroflexia bacterium]|jgi:hypothetical protein